VQLGYGAAMTDDPEMLAYLSQYREFHRMEFFEPYPKQWEFINLGAVKNERCLFAGNRYGKSETGAFETACHCTGFYPPEWKGRRFDHPVNAWVAGEGGQHNRDVLQYKLFGPPGNPDALGSGFIPRDALVGQPTAARGGVADAFDTAQIKHYTNGVFDGLSRLQFKSYEQGRKKFQGADLDLIWWDEEPTEDVYVEGKARTINRGGMTFMTFTPLQGMSAVVKRFWNNTTDELIGHVLMGPKHALHIGEKELAAMLSAYPKYQHRARMEGIPMLGTGAIFNANEESLKYDPAIYVPDYWLKLWGIDFGMSHPFAAVFCLWDRETDVFYVHKEYRVTGALPIVHADAILRIAGDYPVAWPHDGNRTESPRRLDLDGGCDPRNAAAHGRWPVPRCGGLARLVAGVPPVPPRRGRQDRQGGRRPDVGDDEGHHDEAQWPRRPHTLRCTTTASARFWICFVRPDL
jgi:phage terminase large subunit-like protein